MELDTPDDVVQPRFMPSREVAPEAGSRAVVLLSGGLDSATVAAIAIELGYRVHALSFDYGQRHSVELESARKLAAHMGVDHRCVRLDLGGFGGSSLTDPRIAVPKGTDPGASGIPTTYVPARNTVFLAVALGLAEALSAHHIFFGANALDYSGYPDCRPEFVRAFEQLANLATRDAVEGRVRYQVHAPLMAMTKSEIIRRGAELGVDFTLTHSCYDPVGSLACGRCESCTLRKRGFEEAGIEDPTIYV